MWRLCMAWSIIIISDLIARAVHSLNGCCWRAHERGVAIIRKLVLRMRCMQWRSKTCRPCGVESAYVGVEGTHLC